MGRQSPQPRSTHIVICRILSAALITKLGTYALSSLVRMSFGSFEQDLSHHHLHRSQSYLSWLVWCLHLHTLGAFSSFSFPLIRWWSLEALSSLASPCHSSHQSTSYNPFLPMPSFPSLLFGCGWSFHSSPLGFVTLSHSYLSPWQFLAWHWYLVWMCIRQVLSIASQISLTVPFCWVSYILSCDRSIWTSASWSFQWCLWTLDWLESEGFDRIWNLQARSWSCPNLAWMCTPQVTCGASPQLPCWSYPLRAVTDRVAYRISWIRFDGRKDHCK